jgi:endonuclease YncB( thermonuclease family)
MRRNPRPAPYRRRRYTRRKVSTARKILDYGLAFAILGLLLLVVARLDQVETREQKGIAVVNDGDTITLGEQRMRLRGIDAPEYTQICQRNGQNYECGKQSRTALVRLIGGKPISCSGWEKDKYDRLLAVCKSGDVDLNGALVAAGWAVSYGDYRREEAAAREAGIGLWAGTFERPRDWRANRGEMIDSTHDYLGSLFNWLREIFRLS